jgi:ribosomal protein S18 acetylase RimI-like enzyme
MYYRCLNHLPSELKNSAACLYVDALKDKVTPIFGGSSRARRVLVRGLVPDHCLTAFWNDNFVGLLGIQNKNGGLFNISLNAMIREYGLLRGVYRYFGLCLLHHINESDEWYVDGVAVDEKMRGKGVGTGLLGYLEFLAKEKGVKKITLEVIDSNPKAMALYNRLGFIKTNQSNVWPFNHIYKFPFKTVTMMEKVLNHNDVLTSSN